MIVELQLHGKGSGLEGFQLPIDCCLVGGVVEGRPAEVPYPEDHLPDSGATGGPQAGGIRAIVDAAIEQVRVGFGHHRGWRHARITLVPMSALPPGYLLLRANPGEHVAMYVSAPKFSRLPNRDSM